MWLINANPALLLKFLHHYYYEPVCNPIITSLCWIHVTDHVNFLMIAASALHQPVMRTHSNEKPLPAIMFDTYSLPLLSCWCGLLDPPPRQDVYWCTVPSQYTHRYYTGPQAFILINDLDMLKQIMVKDFDNFTDHTVSSKCKLWTSRAYAWHCGFQLLLSWWPCFHYPATPQLPHRRPWTQGSLHL